MTKGIDAHFDSLIPRGFGVQPNIYVDLDSVGSCLHILQIMCNVQTRPHPHNMNLRQADPKYVEAITSDPDLETLFLHMQAAGVGVTLKKRN